jgi:predicted acylesterase/phospholipase RssA
MAGTHSKTAIAFQGGGALGAYAFGALKRIYEDEPAFRPSCVSGVSIGAFTAAIVASHPENPIPKLQDFWSDLTVMHSAFLPPAAERFLAYFGNSAFYWPRLDYFRLPFWTNFYELGPIRRTLETHVDLARIARADVKLVVTATDIESGEIVEFANNDPAKPITMDHLIASGSLPPSYPAKEIGGRSYWDGGLFDNTPLSALLKQIGPEEAAETRIIVINLFPNAGAIPKNMLEVFDRMTELQFANKTATDVGLAQKINKLVAIIEELQGKPAGAPGSILSQSDFSELRKYKVFDNIIAIANCEPEPVSSSADFSARSIERRIAAGYRDAEAALAHPPKSATDLKAAVPKPVQEPAPKPAQEPAPKPAPEPALKPASKPAPETARKPEPNPASKPAPKPARGSGQKRGAAAKGKR